MSEKETMLSVVKDAVHRFRDDQIDLLRSSDESPAPHAFESGVFGEDGYHQVEIDVFFDDADKRNKRVLGLIDNGRGLKGSYSLIVNEQGEIVSEGGQVDEKRGWWWGARDA